VLKKTLGHWYCPKLRDSWNQYSLQGVLLFYWQDVSHKAIRKDAGSFFGLVEFHSYRQAATWAFALLVLP